MKSRRLKLDYFPWFAAKYAADTAHLSKDADYAYRKIIDHIFMHDQVTCRVAFDDTLLMGIARCTAGEWKVVRRALIDGPSPMLMKEEDAWIYSPFLRGVIKEAKKKTRQARDAANERWERERNADGMRTHSGRNASQKSKSKEKTGKKKSLTNNVVSQEDIDYLKDVLRRLGPPSERVTEGHIAAWVEEYRDAAWCAACFAEKHAYIAGRNPEYLETILAERQGQTFEGHSGTRDYVAYVIGKVGQEVHA